MPGKKLLDLTSMIYRALVTAATCRNSFPVDPAAIHQILFDSHSQPSEAQSTKEKLGRYVLVPPGLSR